MNLNNLSRAELRKLAKEQNIADYLTFSKDELVRKLINLGISTEEMSEQEEKEVEKLIEKVKIKKEVVKQPLSFQAKKWKNYFLRTMISPELFLIRYPDHVNKEVIQELINHEKQ